MSRTPLLLTLALAAFCTGCRSVGLTQSGYLSSYDHLTLDEEHRARQSFVGRDVDLSAFDAVVLESLAIHLQESSLDDVDEDEVESLNGEWKDCLLTYLPSRLAVIDEPRPGAVVVRSALTEIDTCHVLLNWVTGLAVLWPVDVGGATLEVELVDAATGEQLAVLVNADKATLWNGIGAMTHLGHACQALDETAEWVGDVLTAEDVEVVPSGDST